MNDLSNIRTGRITSSEIVAIVSNGRTKGEPGAPFFTYVEECIMERFFKQTLENKTEVLAMAWGKLCENIVHEMLGFEYVFHSDVTLVHSQHAEWVGSPDGSKDNTETVTDIKCPLTRKAFYNLIRPLYDFDGLNVKLKENINGNEIIQQIRANSKEGEKYYWQLVSNACITGAKYAELIVFMPYFEDINQIHEYNEQLDPPYWLVARERDRVGALPFIYKDLGIDSLNIIRFEVPESDKQFLTDRVKKAIELINKS